jgi:Mrp family chromosome partitioning ATPase
MGGLLRESRDLADVVLIDTAPLLAASDVFDLLPLVDTVVIVVRHGRLTEAAGNRVAELLGRFQVPVSGVVVVGAQTKRSGAYGYGYGYGEQKKKAKHSTRGREGATVSEEHVNGAAAESRRGRRTSRSV